MFQNTAFAFVVRVLSRDRLMRPRLPELKAVLRYEEEGQIVDWDGDDPENPKNWPFRYKVFLSFLVCMMTTFVYMGSSIVSPAIELIQRDFHVGQPVASLSLSLFVWGYGLGPCFLSPLSEISAVGRNWIYVISLGIFFILQVPTALVGNVAGFLILRFLTGVAGSPVISTGGASMGDMWRLEGGFANAIAFWGFAACGGPVVGPVIGGFTSQALGWRWTIWPLLFASATAWVMIFFFLPETGEQSILTLRARELRRVTGNQELRSRGELSDQHVSTSKLLYETFCRPVELTITEPIMLFSNSYIAYVYGILYCFFESYPITLMERHGFNAGQLGLSFISGWVFVLIALFFYTQYNNRFVARKFQDGTWRPEYRMVVCLIGGILMAGSLFWFGWTSFPAVLWISPLVAFGVFTAGMFYLFQGFLGYIGENYPRYMASAYASNSMLRAAVAGAFPIFSTIMFHKLTVQGGCSLLGGLGLLLIPFTVFFYFRGDRLRARSKKAGMPPL